VQHDKDTDWYSFNTKEVALMKGVLAGVLRSELFRPTEDDEFLLEFLKVDKSTESLAADIPF
jgi:hypothetical protein